MKEEEKILLEFLLADFNAMKSEIARRSNLQKAAIAALLALYAWIFNTILNNGNSVEIIVISWGSAILVGTHVYRERREIKRLGWIIKNNVAKQAGEIIGVDENLITPSEAHALEPNDDSLRKFISALFSIVIYFAVPLFLTLKSLFLVS
jgi:hypothetical protein